MEYALQSLNTIRMTRLLYCAELAVTELKCFNKSQRVSKYILVICLIYRQIYLPIYISIYLSIYLAIYDCVDSCTINTSRTSKTMTPRYVWAIYQRESLWNIGASPSRIVVIYIDIAISRERRRQLLKPGCNPEAIQLHLHCIKSVRVGYDRCTAL